MNRRRFLRGMLAAAAITAAGPLAARRLAVPDAVSLGALTQENIIDYILELGTVFDEQNIPDTNRVLYLPRKAFDMLMREFIRGPAVEPGRDMLDRFEVRAAGTYSHGVSAWANHQKVITDEVHKDTLERRQRWITPFEFRDLPPIMTYR